MVCSVPQAAPGARPRACTAAAPKRSVPQAATIAPEGPTASSEPLMPAGSDATRSAGLRHPAVVKLQAISVSAPPWLLGHSAVAVPSPANSTEGLLVAVPTT